MFPQQSTAPSERSAHAWSFPTAISRTSRSGGSGAGALADATGEAPASRGGASAIVGAGNRALAEIVGASRIDDVGLGDAAHAAHAIAVAKRFGTTRRSFTESAYASSLALG